MGLVFAAAIREIGNNKIPNAVQEQKNGDSPHFFDCKT